MAEYNDFSTSAAQLASTIDSLSNSISDYKSRRYASDRALEGVEQTNLSNLQIARETNRANQQLYEQQVADTWEMQRHNEAYNSAKAEVQRLREAGLNPAMVFDSPFAGQLGMPSANPAVGATMEGAPYQAYSDMAARPLTDILSKVLQGMSGYEDVKSKQIDNMTRDAANRMQLSKMLADIDKIIDDKQTSDAQRGVLRAQRDTILSALRLTDATYEDRVEQEKLRTRYQNLQNQSLDQSITLEASRFALEQLSARDAHAMNEANIKHVNALAQSVVNADWRANDLHQFEYDMKGIERQFKALGLTEASREAVLQDIMRKSEAIHTELKDNSELNKIAERLFGLGFRDLGTAIRNLITK